MRLVMAAAVMVLAGCGRGNDDVTLDIASLSAGQTGTAVLTNHSGVEITYNCCQLVWSAQSSSARSPELDCPLVAKLLQNGQSVQCEVTAPETPGQYNFSLDVGQSSSAWRRLVMASVEVK